MGVPGVRWPRASLALAGGTPGGKPCAEMGLVFMLEADEQVTSLFLFRGFSSTSESHSDGKAQFSLVGRVQLVPYFLPSASQPRAETKQFQGWTPLPT